MANYAEIGSSDINTAAKALAANPGLFPEYWEKELLHNVRCRDPLAGFKGTGDDSVIKVHRDVGNGAGAANKKSIRQLGGLYGEGVRGATRISEESLRQNVFTLTGDFVRHAVSVNKKFIKRFGSKELERYLLWKDKLADWRVWRDTNDTLALWSLFNEDENDLYSNGNSDVDSLYSSDNVSVSFLTEMAEAMATSGAKPLKISLKDDQELFQYCFFAVKPALVGMENSDDYQDKVQNASLRGGDNPMWSGQIPTINGEMAVKKWQNFHTGDDAPEGSLMSAVAILGEAVAGTQTTSFEMKGGGDFQDDTDHVDKKYFCFFRNYAYQMGEDDNYNNHPILTLPGTLEEKYALIRNPDGTIGMVAYKANSGEKLTITKILAAADDGIQQVTVGDVVWTGGVSGKIGAEDYTLTSTFQKGAMIFDCNSKGVPFCRSFVLGSCASHYLIGSPGDYEMGKFADRAAEVLYTYEQQDNGMLMRPGIEYWKGEGLHQRIDGKIPNVKVVYSAAKYNAWKLPTITSAAHHGGS